MFTLGSSTNCPLRIEIGLVRCNGKLTRVLSTFPSMFICVAKQVRYCVIANYELKYTCLRVSTFEKKIRNSFDVYTHIYIIYL